MNRTKRVNRHSNAIRRNTALHAQAYAAIAEQKDRAGRTKYLYIFAYRNQRIGWRITT